MNNLKKIVLIVLFFSANFIFAQYDIDKVRNNEITKEEIYEHIKYLRTDTIRRQQFHTAIRYDYRFKTWNRKHS
jgi:hypothetical protein